MRNRGGEGGLERGDATERAYRLKHIGRHLAELQHVLGPLQVGKVENNQRIVQPRDLLCRLPQYYIQMTKRESERDAEGCTRFR